MIFYLLPVMLQTGTENWRLFSFAPEFSGDLVCMAKMRWSVLSDTQVPLLALAKEGHRTSLASCATLLRFTRTTPRTHFQAEEVLLHANTHCTSCYSLIGLHSKVQKLHLARNRARYPVYFARTH